MRAGRAWVCHLDISPITRWVTDHDQTGFGVTCELYTDEQLSVLNWQDLKALGRLGRLLPPFIP